MTDVHIQGQLDRMAGMPVSGFVLHRKPMLLLDRLLSIEPESAICEWCVQDGNQFLVPELGVPAYVGIEYMAQCVAVHAGVLERVSGFPPPVGLLLGTRHYKSSVRYFDLGASYRVKCRELIRNTDGLGSFECGILLDDRFIVEARLSVLQLPRGESING